MRKKKISLGVFWSLMVLLFTMAMNSCVDYDLQNSGTLNETGEVVAKDYTAVKNGSVTTMNMDMDANIGIGVGSVHVPETFSIVFTCEHGTVFTVKNKQVYSKLHVGDKVTITYKEVYRVYEDGHTELHDLDFIDANKVKR